MSLMSLTAVELGKKIKAKEVTNADDANNITNKSMQSKQKRKG
jgi:hypothetical protein